jgi:hypothetical protein
MSGKYKVEIRHDDRAMLSTLMKGADNPHLNDPRIINRIQDGAWGYEITAVYPATKVVSPLLSIPGYAFELILGLEINGWWLEEWLSIEATYPCYVQGLSGADRWQEGHVIEPFEKCDCCDGYNCPQSGSKFDKVEEG